jgi:cutinase
MFTSKLLLILTAAVITLASPLEKRQSCADVTVIFARGTGEEAPIGTIVGPPFESALQSALRGMTLSFQGVNYPASVAGFEEGGDPQGLYCSTSSCFSLLIIVL